METKKFFSELGYTFHAFGRLLRKAFNHKEQTRNDLNHNFITFNSTYLNCTSAFH